MRIHQVILPGASQYELKSQRVDRALLEARGHAVADPSDAGRADLAHVYGPDPLPRAEVRRLTVRWVSNAAVAPSRWPWFGRASAPAAVLSPFGGENAVPEAVEDGWFEAMTRETDGARKTIGSFAGGRVWVRDMAGQTMMRIHRFRDDIEWRLFDAAPSPEDLTGVDVWVDPARDDRDLDGFVAEALVSGVPVIAARTRINELRSNKGTTAQLVPTADSNELTHAILTALFKPEVARQKVQAARLTAAKFRAGQRARILIPIYESLTR